MPKTNQKPSDMHIQDFCEDKARAGEGAYAIAYALLELATAQQKTARSLERLGTNEAVGAMGAVELLSSEVKHVGEALQAISENLLEK